MKKSYSGYIYILLCTLIFSMVEVVLKMVAGVFHPMQITALRFFIGGAVLLPFALRSIRSRHAVLTKADVRFFALMGLLFVCVAMSLYQMSVVYAKASVAAIVFSCNPIFVTVFAYLILHEEIRKNHIAALVIELSAVLVIVDPLHAQVDPVGVVFGILSAVIFAAYSVLGKKRAARLGGIAVTGLCALFGSVELLLLLLLGHTDAGIALFSALRLDLYCNVPILSGFSTSSLPWLLYIGVVNTGLGFVCHMMAMEKTSAREASLIFFLKPIFAPLFALLLLREEIALNVWLGIALFVIGSGASVLPGLLHERKAARQKNT